MNLEALIASRGVTDLGWTLVHSIWQIGLVAGVLSAALRLLKASTGNIRYLVSLTALVAAVTLPGVTFVQISTSSTPSGAGIEAANFRDGEAALDGGIGVSNRARTGEKTASSNSAVTNATASINDIGGYLGERIPNILPFTVGLW